ncbi:MAG: hypothetical protein U0Z26_07460 [Anaerolineales bacterium]
MKLKPIILSVLGAVLFITGILIGLGVSAAYAWAESEAYVFSTYNADGNLHLKCPVLLSPNESGLVTGNIVNVIDRNIKPQVSSQISHPGLPLKAEQTVELVVGESKTLEWTVSASDNQFNRLILVNVIQSHYQNNPSYVGSCGILLFSLFGLNGNQTLILLFVASLVAMISGGLILLLMQVRPMDNYAVNLTRICSVLMGMAILALFGVLPRLWVLTIFLDALVLLIAGVIFTDFILFPQKYKD